MKKFNPEKIAKMAADRFSEGVSSGIIVVWCAHFLQQYNWYLTQDHFEFANKNLIARIKNSIKTRHSLNLAEGCFVDFRRKDFPAQAAEFYLTLNKAVHRKDKVELMKRLSVPLYDVKVIPRAHLQFFVYILSFLNLDWRTLKNFHLIYMMKLLMPWLCKVIPSDHWICFNSTFTQREFTNHHQ